MQFTVPSLQHDENESLNLYNNVARSRYKYWSERVSQRKAAIGGTAAAIGIGLGNALAEFYKKTEQEMHDALSQRVLPEALVTCKQKEEQREAVWPLRRSATASCWVRHARSPGQKLWAPVGHHDGLLVGRPW